MLDWLLSPIDASRAHEVGAAVSWHARSMVLAWGVLAPVAVILARFFKITPRQDWPRELDNQFWWRCHLIGQTSVAILSVIGLAVIFWSSERPISTHGILGYAVLAGLVLQVLFGILRGDKGGPTAPAPDGSPRGHHYDMTLRRRMFEMAHKALGYMVLALAAITILYGLWMANAPRWMWTSLALWWPSLLVVFVVLQRRGFAVDTYQAIWGPGAEHPGNTMPALGWGVRRPGDAPKPKQASKTQDGETSHVRSDRGDGLRSP